MADEGGPKAKIIRAFAQAGHNDAEGLFADAGDVLESYTTKDLKRWSLYLPEEQEFILSLFKRVLFMPNLNPDTTQAIPELQHILDSDIYDYVNVSCTNRSNHSDRIKRNRKRRRPKPRADQPPYYPSPSMNTTVGVNGCQSNHTPSAFDCGSPDHLRGNLYASVPPNNSRMGTPNLVIPQKQQTGPIYGPAPFMRSRTPQRSFVTCDSSHFELPPEACGPYTPDSFQSQMPVSDPESAIRGFEGPSYAIKSYEGSNYAQEWIGESELS